MSCILLGLKVYSRLFRSEMRNVGNLFKNKTYLYARSKHKFMYDLFKIFRLSKIKKILRRGFRATLNFRWL